MSSEVSDALVVFRKAKQNKRRRNAEKSKKILDDREVPYVVMNKGYHVVILDDEGNPLFDFWPSTGKYLSRERATSFKQSRAPCLHEGRGVFNLLKLLENYDVSIRSDIPT